MGAPKAIQNAGLTILKILLSLTIVPGIFMVLIGLNIAENEDMVALAEVWTSPVGVPVKPFLILLGSCKVLGILSLWGVGPMPEWFARAGLITAASCGAYSYHVVEGGFAWIPPVVYVAMMLSLYTFDGNKAKWE